MSVCPRTRSTTRAASDPRSARSPVTPMRATAYTNPACPGTDPLHPLWRARRRDKEHRVDPGPVGLGRPRTELFDGEVGHDGSSHTRGRQRAGHPLVAGAEDEVVIRHDDHGDGHFGPRDAVEHLLGCRPPGERAQRCLLDDRTVDHGVRERDPHLHCVGARCDQRRQRVSPVLGHAAHQIWDQQLAAAFTPRPQLLFEVRHRRLSCRRSRGPAQRPCRRGPRASPTPSILQAMRRCRRCEPPRRWRGQTRGPG